MSLVAAGAPVFGTSTKTAYVIARDAEYAGTALFFGGVAFVAGIWPAGATALATRRLLGAAWLLGSVATLAALGLDGAWVSSAGPSDFFTTRVFRVALNTDFGRQWIVMSLLWGLGLVVLADLLRRGEVAARSLPWRVGAAAVGLGTLRVFGLTGHSGDTVHPVVAQLADLVHLTAMTLWIGGLAMLLVGVLPRKRPEELRVVVPRYSMLALVCVATVIGTGTVLAWRIVGSLHELTSTTYGHLLLVKITLLAVIMAAAFGSKTWVEHRLDFAVILRGSRVGLVRPFVTSVAVETALVLLVLTVASFLVTADPGR